MKTYKFIVNVGFSLGEIERQEFTVTANNVAGAYLELCEAAQNANPEAYDFEILGEEMQGLGLEYFAELGDLHLITEF